MSSPAESAGSGLLPRSSSEQERVDAKDNKRAKPLTRLDPKGRDDCIEFVKCFHDDIGRLHNYQLKFTSKIRKVCGSLDGTLFLVSQIFHFEGLPPPRDALEFYLTYDSGIFEAWRELAKAGLDGIVYWQPHAVIFRYIKASHDNFNHADELKSSDIPDGNDVLALADWSKPDGTKIASGDKCLILYPGFKKMYIDEDKDGDTNMDEDEDTNMEEDENLDEEL